MSPALDEPTRALRIVHVFRAPLGGLFRHVVDLAREQVARGHEVGMFFDSGVASATIDRAIESVGPLTLGLLRRPIPRNPSHRDLGGIAACNAFLTRVGADVAHGHGSKGGLYARSPGLVNAGTGPVRAYTPHGGSFNYQPGAPAHRLYMGVERILARATDMLLFESAYIASRFDSYVGRVGAPRRIVPNGLSDAEFKPAEANVDAADLLYVGELRAAKGVDTLLKAIALIKTRSGRAPTACLVGSGPDRDLLQNMASGLGLADAVTFPGAMPIREAFKRGRVLVVPSRAESMPYVVLEAAGARVPMVATRVGGIPEIFGPFGGRLGPCDDERDLADRIDALRAADPAQISEDAADLALYVAARFSIARMADAVLGGYREAIAARADARPATAREAV